MKDECYGHVMRAFVGLKPKMYSFSYEGDPCSRREEKS